MDSCWNNFAIFSWMTCGF